MGARRKVLQEPSTGIDGFDQIENQNNENPVKMSFQYEIAAIGIASNENDNHEDDDIWDIIFKFMSIAQKELEEVWDLLADEDEGYISDEELHDDGLSKELKRVEDSGKVHILNEMNYDYVFKDELETTASTEEEFPSFVSGNDEVIYHCRSHSPDSPNRSITVHSKVQKNALDGGQKLRSHLASETLLVHDDPFHEQGISLYCLDVNSNTIPTNVIARKGTWFQNIIQPLQVLRPSIIQKSETLRSLSYLNMNRGSETMRMI